MFYVIRDTPPPRTLASYLGGRLGRAEQVRGHLIRCPPAPLGPGCGGPGLAPSLAKRETTESRWLAAQVTIQLCRSSPHHAIAARLIPCLCAINDLWRQKVVGPVNQAVNQVT